jgi:hypothetical protein
MCSMSLMSKPSAVCHHDEMSFGWGRRCCVVDDSEMSSVEAAAAAAEQQQQQQHTPKCCSSGKCSNSVSQKSSFILSCSSFFGSRHLASLPRDVRMHRRSKRRVSGAGAHLKEDLTYPSRPTRGEGGVVAGGEEGA